MGIEALSDADLLALKSGDLSKVSNEGLLALKSDTPTSTPLPERPANLRQPQEPSGFDKFVGKLPTSGVLSDVGGYFANAATGATGLMRGAANLIPTEGRGWGDAAFPPAPGSAGSVGKTVGGFLDPVALAIGGGVGKALPYAPVLGRGAVEGAKAIGKNLIGGATVGGAIGGLSEEGTALEGAGIGAAINVAMPPVIMAGAKAAGKLADALSGKLTTSMAASILKGAAGSELPAIEAAMRANPNLTPAQAAAAAGIKQDTWYAIHDLSKRVDKESFFTKLSARQKEEIVDGLRKLAVAPTQTEARQVAAQSKTNLGNITNPMRETALDLANQSGTLRPLDPGSIAAALDKQLADPKIGTSDINAKVIGRVQEKIKEWTNEGGVIDANALYGIRKSAVNETVEQLMGTADPKSKSKMAAGLLNRVKPFIDDAIENAGGKGWKDYLKTFETGMTQINQQKMGAKALDLFNKQPNTLESLVAGNEPKMVEKIFKSEFDLRKAMGPKMPTVEAAANYLAREREVLEGAARGAGGLDQILDDNIQKFKLPNWINAKIAVTNRALSEIEKRVNAETMKKVEFAMRSNATANQLLNFVPLSDRAAVAAAILRGHGAFKGGVVSGIEGGDDQEQPTPRPVSPLDIIGSKKAGPASTQPPRTGVGFMGVRS